MLLKIRTYDGLLSWVVIDKIQYIVQRDNKIWWIVFNNGDYLSIGNIEIESFIRHLEQLNIKEEK